VPAVVQEQQGSRARRCVHVFSPCRPAWLRNRRCCLHLFAIAPCIVAGKLIIHVSLGSHASAAGV
jgi:hypothetical protein